LSPKIVKTINDVVRECELPTSYIVEMIAEYFSYYLNDHSKRHEGNCQPVLNWKATAYNTLSIPVTVMGTVEDQKRMPVRWTGNRPWRAIYPPRKDIVFIWMDNITRYGALQGRLPARLRCLFKTVEPMSKKTHRLAIVETFEPENGGSLGEDHGLVTVAMKRTDRVPQSMHRGAGRTFNVPICKVLGPAHLIPHEPHGDNTKWFVNSTIDLETYNVIYETLLGVIRLRGELPLMRGQKGRNCGGRIDSTF
jgi:hypothetical protein